MNNNLTVIDLFCGGGIGAVGVKEAGFNIIYALDIDKYAVSTYNKNIGNHCVQKDIRKIDINDIPDSDIILGSPVCKSFSFAGSGRGFDDDKYGDLPNCYLNVVKEKKPKVIVFENVKGMLSKKHINNFNKFLSLLEGIGYNISYKLLNAHHYGVPQLRERVIVVGIRKDLNKVYKFPEPIKEELRPTIFDAIGDLPQPTKVMNSKADIQYINNDENKTPNHIGYGIRNDEKPFVDKIDIGSNWKCLSEEEAKKFLGKAFYNGGGRTGFLRKVDIYKPSYTITATMLSKNNAQILDLKENYKIKNQDIYYNSGFSSRYLSRNRQKQWNEASFTIVSEVRQLPLYPFPANFDIRKIDQYDISPPRRFTVRECLRLQSVPDYYEIDEDISLSKQYEIVGNGIPSLLMYLIFINIKECLNND